MIVPGSIRTALLAGSYAAAGILGWVLHNGIVYQPHLKKDAHMALRVEKAVRRVEATSEVITQDHRNHNDTQQEAVREVTRTIVKTIPLYLPGPPVDGERGGGAGDTPGDADRGTPYVPVGLGRLHDYAALGLDPPVPSPSGEDLRGASGVTLPGLAGTLTENYGLCRSYWVEAVTWRRWYEEQAGAWPGEKDPGK